VRSCVKKGETPTTLFKISDDEKDEQGASRPDHAHGEKPSRKKKKLLLTSERDFDAGGGEGGTVDAQEDNYDQKKRIDGRQACPIVRENSGEGGQS